MRKSLKNKNSGFSLVEILVVLAIMAVITVAVVPSFTNYVEKSKVEKDTNRMEELVTIIELSLADEETYTDMVQYAVYGNASCYVDPSAQEEYAKDKTDMYGYETTYAETRLRQEQFTFTDEWRDEDKVERVLAGNMYGITITFKPEDKIITFADGRFNMALNGYTRWYTGEEDGTDGPGADMNYGEYGTISKMKSENNPLLRTVLSNMSQSLELESRTYEQSSYTVFIRLAPPLEAETIEDEANISNAPIGRPQQTVKVYGQWNGTYLKKAK